MDITFIIAVIVIIIILTGFILNRKARNRVLIVFEMASVKYSSELKHSIFGISQLMIFLNERIFRITPMYHSTSSAKGGAEMTCIDFPVMTSECKNFRIQEKSSFRRTASPKELFKNRESFLLQIPEFDSRFILCGLNQDQLQRFINNSNLIKSILALPAGADIQVKNNLASISINGFPDKIEQIDMLINISQKLIEFIEIKNI